MRRSLAAAVAFLLVVLAGCGGDAEAKPFSGRVLDNPFAVPATELTDTDGQPFSLTDDTDARLTLMFFGYVNCVDVCPAVLSNLASAMTRLDDADRDDVQVVVVTSDPDTDTPESMREYLDRYDSSFVGLTGDWETIESVGGRLAVGLDRRDPGAHTTQVMGIDGADEATIFWSQDTSPSQYADDIHSLLEDS